jgi:hypothetical protein
MSLPETGWSQLVKTTILVMLFTYKAYAIAAAIALGLQMHVH